MTKSIRHSQEYISSYFLNMGCEIIGEYKGANIPVDFEKGVKNGQ